MRKTFRYIYVGFSFLVLVAIVLQVFFAGLMMFGGSGGRELHVNVGWTLHLAVAPMLFIPALAGAGRRAVLLGIALVVFM